NAEGETDGFVDGATSSEGSGANPADGERDWAIDAFEDDAPPLPQVPAVRPSVRNARSSGSTSLGDAWEEEEGGVISFPFSPLHWTARNRRKRRICVPGLRSMSQST